MNIEVFNRYNQLNVHIYQKVEVEDIGDMFTVFDTFTGRKIEYTYNSYGWRELTTNEARAAGIYTKENENLKYKLSVDDSGYGMNCTECERIIFIKPKAGDSVELDSKKLSELDWININGIKFKREK